MSKMYIKVNSKLRELPYPITVAEFVQQEKVPEGGTAIAINGKVVRRAEWDGRLIVENDDIVLIRAAYGG